LASGHEVVPFAGDIRERDSIHFFLESLDYVIHLAAVVPVDHVRDDLANAIHVNVIGSVHLAEAVSKKGSCGLAYISSSHVYAPSDSPLSEDAPTRPLSQYGLTKLHGENWVSSILPEALVLRVFSFFDHHQPASYLVPALTGRIRSADHGAVLPLRGAQCRRDIADASWIAGICAALVDQRATGIVNCGTGRSFLVREIAEKLAAAMGRSDVSWEGFTDDAINALVADTNKLRQLLGTELEFDLEKALAVYVESLR
jgi:UDP-glucose 4-epimerase/GDP-4-dehydro-6-deoxy-D-mannose reductase